jgi:phosphate:Na+ symporter
VGRVLIGLGLMLLALRLVTASTEVLTQAPAVKALLASLSSDLLLEITAGAFLAVVSYSSLAIVLLTATLAASGVHPPRRGAGPGTGRQPRQRPAGRADHLRSPVEVRQVPLGNLMFKLLGIVIAAPFIGRGCATCGPTWAKRPPWSCCST